MNEKAFKSSEDIFGLGAAFDEQSGRVLLFTCFRGDDGRPEECHNRLHVSDLFGLSRSLHKQLVSFIVLCDTSGLSGCALLVMIVSLVSPQNIIRANTTLVTKFDDDVLDTKLTHIPPTIFLLQTITDDAEPTEHTAEDVQLLPGQQWFAVLWSLGQRGRPQQ